LKIKVQGVRLPNLDAQERVVAGIAGPRDHALFLYVQKAATNCASGSLFRIHSRMAVNGKDDMPGTKDCAKISSISAGAESFTISILTRSQPFQNDLQDAAWFLDRYSGKTLDNHSIHIYN